MNFSAFIGIDVSKETIDVFLRDKNVHACFKNNPSGFVKMIDWANTKNGGNMAGALFAFEHTGLYSLGLSLFLHENKFRFAVIPGLELKRSLGIARGKSDKIDARAIAEYAYEKREKIKLYQMPGKNILRLKSLLSLRERMVKERAAFKTRLKEYTLFLDREENALLFDVQSDMIDSYDHQIQKVEDELYRLIKEDEKLAGQYNLVTSIKGIGPQTAMMMIVITNGFTLFEEWRKFASYSGIAPFPNSSGKYKGKTRTNNLANKRMKTLLSCCAVCAVP